MGLWCVEVSCARPRRGGGGGGGIRGTSYGLVGVLVGRGGGLWAAGVVQGPKEWE